MPTNQTPDALAQAIKDAVGEYANLIRMGRAADAITVLSKLIADTDRLRDMAASGAKDAISFEQAAQPLMKWLGGNVHPHHTAIVTSTDAELLEGKQTLRTTQYVKD